MFLPNVKTLNLTKLKAFSAIELNAAHLILVIDKVENIVGNIEI